MSRDLAEGQQVKVRTPISKTWRDATIICKSTSSCYRVRFDNGVTCVVSRTRIKAGAR